MGFLKILYVIRIIVYDTIGLYDIGGYDCL